MFLSGYTSNFEESKYTHPIKQLREGLDANTITVKLFGPWKIFTFSENPSNSGSDSTTIEEQSRFEHGF